MLEKITKIIARFFGIIAGSLSGISAILIAVGYLAERSHLKMLGFTNIPVDLNQYLYTGSILLGFLPGIIILQSISLVLEPLVLVIFSVILLARLSRRIPSVKVWGDKVSNSGKHFIARFRHFFLILLVVAQMISLNWMVKAVLVENLLFTEVNATAPAKFTFLTANTDALKQLILTKDEKLPRYFTQLFLSVLLIGLALRYIMSVKKEKDEPVSFHVKFWATINFLLFATQVILVPCNYGVLLLNSKYQEVKTQFKTVGQKNDFQKTAQKSQLNASQVARENAIRNQKLETHGIPFRYNLEAKPQVFTNPEGDMLTYSATSTAPDVAQAEIDGNVLIITPLETGDALITVVARNSEGKEGSVSFSVNVADEIDIWGAEVANQIPPQTLMVGDKPFVRNLMADPTVFRLLDQEPVQLTFQVNCESAQVAGVKISGNVLEVQPLLKGNAVVSVTANDGYGRMVSTEFNVVVLDQKLQWPEDDRLLLIYQSDDEFYLYSKLEKRIWYVRSNDIESMVYYGLAEAF